MDTILISHNRILIVAEKKDNKNKMYHYNLSVTLLYDSLENSNIFYPKYTEGYIDRRDTDKIKFISSPVKQDILFEDARLYLSSQKIVGN